MGEEKHRSSSKYDSSRSKIFFLLWPSMTGPENSIMTLRTRFALNSADILVLWSFALAQPVFSILAKHPEFFVARQSQPIEILLLAVGLIFAVPLVCILCEVVALLLRPGLLSVVHGAFVSSFSALLLLPVLRKIPGITGLWVVILAGTLGLVASVAYLRLRTSRKSLLFLVPAVLIFPLLFLLGSPISKLVFKKNVGEDSRQFARRAAPIVMVVLDEFPLSSLLNSAFQINAARYPHFAELAKQSTWYRKATTVSEATLGAMPSIMTGRYPRPKLALLPNATDYPRNLFTLLKDSYEFNVQENLTQLCPESICAGDSKSYWLRETQTLVSDLTILYLYFVLPNHLTAGLPDITHSWKSFANRIDRRRPIRELMAKYENLADWDDRPSQFREFADSIHPSTKPTLHFLHMLLPHAIWEFLPSGKRYTLDTEIRGTRGTNSEGVDPNLWCEDAWTVAESYQRHLLQVQLADDLVGYLINHLKKVALFDPSLLIVTADHGCSFRPGDSRRRVTSTNYADILSVPLFIKTPFQQEGIIDDRNVEIVDILPTITKVLDVTVPWEMDGYPLTQGHHWERNNKRLIRENGEILQFPPSLDVQAKTVQKKLSLFGTGESPDQLFKAGPFGSLVGRAVHEIPQVQESSLIYELDHKDFFGAVDLSSPIVLTHVTGKLLASGNEPYKSRPLAVAVNGTIRGTSQTYQQAVEERFSTVTPESAYQEGHNEIAVYEIGQSGNELFLSRLQSTERGSNYTWGDAIHFGTSGNSEQYKLDGWSAPDGPVTWILGQWALLSLRTAQPPGPMVLRARVQAYLHPPEVSTQRVRVLVNRKLVGEWVFKDRRVHDEVLAVPPDAFNLPNQTMIAIQTSDAVAPSSVNDGPDVRKLSLAVYKLSIDPMEAKQESR